MIKICGQKYSDLSIKRIGLFNEAIIYISFRDLIPGESR